MSRTFAVLLALVHVAPSQDSLTPIQTVSLVRVSTPVVSPDGKLVAFYRSAPRMAGDAPGGHYRHLWVMPAGGKPTDARRLMGGKRAVSGAAFRPDGTAVTYLDTRDAPHREVFALPLDGGEPARVTRSQRGVGSYKWSPDGRMIAFTSSDPQPKARAKARKMGFRQQMFEEDWTHTSLWIWDVAKGAARRLTEGTNVLSYEWAGDGSKLAIGASPRNLVDDAYMFARLWAVDVASGKRTKLVENPGKLGPFAWSPDGSRLAYISAQNPRDPHAGMLYFLEPTGKVTAFNDGFKGAFHTVRWVDDDIVEGVLSRGVGTFRYRARSSWYFVQQATGVACRDIVVASDGVGYGAGSSASHPAELFRFESSGPGVRMTNSNPWLEGVTLGKQTVETFKARDGLEIEGILMHPANRSEGARHPLVIVAHGGPESHHSNGWLTSYGNWGQILTGRGYYVWYPNYRASTGYGVKFVMADHGDPMGGEFNDHIDAVKHFVDKGMVDAERVGIGGGSYGGYTAAWAATRHTDVFAAAVSFVPFVDIRTKWMTSDIPWEFYYVHYQEKWPWQQREFLAERSPLSYASKCRTPLLLLGGDKDPRVHPSQPHMLYRAVKMATTTPCRYIRYPGEGHGNRVNTNRYDYLIRTLRWFDHYLKSGDHRKDPPPPVDLDYSAWTSTVK
ncbi:MAG: S9 family peptidase [Planctomycetes bacterium]|nr:S9 family peptidase [Planctomycetota bacterium]